MLYLVSSSGKSGELGQLAVRFADTPRALACGSCGASSSAMAAAPEIHAAGRIVTHSHC